MRINNNRGFTVMLPKTKEETSFIHELKFILFKREFIFSLQVKPTQEADD